MTEISDFLKTILKILGISLAMLIGLNLKINLLYVLFGAYFLAVVLFAIDSRLSIALGLGWLVVTAVVLVFKLQAIAETFAVYAYLFFAIGVIKAVIEHLLDSRHSEEHKRRRMTNT